MRSEDARPARPFGDTFTWPSEPLGAVATKNIGCSEIQLRQLGADLVETLAMTRFSQVAGRYRRSFAAATSDS